MRGGAQELDERRTGAAVSSVVSRPELFELLSVKGTGGVSVVTGPAGSGKTVLVRSWLEAEGLGDQAAWVYVEREERDAQRFWLSVVAALRTVSRATAVVDRLEPAPAFDAEALVTRLAGELASLEDRVVLVLDDVHELHSPPTLRQIELLLTRRPPKLDVVLVSRSWPRLGLHRLRLAGGLTEIRPAQLRFTRQDARELLTSIGVVLTDESLDVLHERTEGWAAGLRLAALALLRHPDPERFVAEFSGSESTVAEYLLAEVLERQAPEVRLLLLRTSILEHVSAPLADHLTGGSGSGAILRELEDENAFVVSLDASRSRFRYHHLFADLLRLELRRTEPDAVPKQHRAAAAWHEQRGDVVEAVKHALLAEDWASSRRLLTESSFGLTLDGQAATVRALLVRFPNGAVGADPELALVAAGAEVWQGSAGNADGYLRSAEAHAGEVPDDRRPRFELLLGLVRLMLARRRGDLAAALAEGERLLAAEAPAPGFDDELRASALMHLGIIELWTARFGDAGRHLEQALELARLSERPYIEAHCLAHLSIVAGRLSFETVREHALAAIAIAEAKGWSVDRVASPALVALASADIWQGRWEDGERWLDRAEQALRPDVEPATAVMLHLTRGRLHTARGEHRQAALCYRAATQLEAFVVAPQLMTAPAYRLLAQTQMSLGDAPAAYASLARLADERYADVTAVAQAHLRLAEEDADGAVAALAPLIAGSVPSLPFLLVEALLVDALARDRLGDRAGVESAVERALKLAEPIGLVWPFVATPVGELLERHARAHTSRGSFLDEVLGALAGSEAVGGTGPAALREPLSESELRVLRYLTSNLRASEIARELYVSVHTVKTHMRHVYAKLGVHSRTEAVSRARELGLLGSSPRLRDAPPPASARRAVA